MTVERVVNYYDFPIWYLCRQQSRSPSVEAPPLIHVEDLMLLLYQTSLLPATYHHHSFLRATFRQHLLVKSPFSKALDWLATERVTSASSNVSLRIKTVQ
jgi:hypothetical protein